MAFVEINPRYQSFLEQWGLTGIEQLQALPALVVCGHPDRHVTQVMLGSGPGAIRAYMKREHRIPWRDRLANAWAGFGPVSKSYREFQMLKWLRNAGIGCADPIAAGEDGQGRAFLLVRELTGALDLRVFLRDRLPDKHPQRLRFIRLLGETLACIHDAGFDHPDLYSKHVLVDPDTGLLRFLDWQRSRRRRFLGWPKRWRDLAALHATLADKLATGWERLAFLRAYLRASLQIPVPRPFLRQAIHQIQRRARHLQRQRRIREMRHTPLAVATQNLIWVKGEALCVTREFQEEMHGQIPDLLSESRQEGNRRNQVRRSVVDLPGLRQGNLIRRWANRPLRWLWTALRGRRLTSPEVEQVGTMFRLQRFGVGTPRLLAVGQRHLLPWRMESFLLTEEPTEIVTLAGWLAEQAGRPLWTAERKQRRQLLHQAGALLRRIHEAGYHGSRFHDRHLVIQTTLTADSLPRLTVILGSLDGIRSHKHKRSLWAKQDLGRVRTTYAPIVNSRTDEMRFMLGYLGLPCLTPEAKHFIRQIGRRSGGVSPPIENQTLPFRFSLFRFPPFRSRRQRAAS
jgi:tRNA A-37 threonylcarbamoyl transferase component Bud32